MGKGVSEMFCRGCGYQLNGLTTPRCPECGRPFDPANRRTWRAKPKRRGVWVSARWVLLATMVLFVLAASPVVWLWWGWHQDHAFVEAFTSRHGTPPMIGQIDSPAWRYWLGKKYGYLLDRTLEIADSKMCPITENEVAAASRSPILRAAHLEDSIPSDEMLIHLGHAKSLQTLYISDFKCLSGKQPSHLTNKGIQALSGLTEIRSLGIVAADFVTDLRPLGTMKKLEYLRVTRTNVDDEGISVVELLPNLVHLDLNETRVTDGGIGHIAKATTIEIARVRLWSQQRSSPPDYR